MATLFNRLKGDFIGDESGKIAVHSFVAAFQEWADGAKMRSDIINFFELTVADQEDLDWLKRNYVASTDKAHFISVLENILILAESDSLNFWGYRTKENFVLRINGLL